MLLVGRIPQTGDTFSYKNLDFEIVDMDGERVDKLLVTKHPEKETEKDEEE